MLSIMEEVGQQERRELNIEVTPPASGKVNGDWAGHQKPLDGSAMQGPLICSTDAELWMVVLRES